MSEKKVKKPNSNNKPIKFFEELATACANAEEIRDAAEKKNYSKSTISIQLGRLRAAGFLPPLEKTEKVKKEKKVKVASISSTVRAVPKPGKVKNVE